MHRSSSRRPLPPLPTRARTRALIACSLAALAPFGLPASAHAAAPALPTLTIHRTDDTLDCPDAATLAARVTRHMGHAALDPGPTSARAGLDVQIYRSEEGYTAVVQTGASTRTLSDRGPTCDGLTAALAITLAILLDELPPPPAIPDLPPDPAPTAAPDRAPTATPDPPLPAPAAPPDPTVRPIARDLPLGLSINASLFTTAGTLEHPVSLAGTASLALPIGSIASIEAGVVAFPPQRFGFPYPVKRPIGDVTPTSAQQVELALTTGLVRGCAGVPSLAGAPRLGGCLGLLAGALAAQGQSFVTNQSAHDPWVALEGSAFLEQRLFWRVALVTRASLLVPLLRRSLTVDGVLDPTKAEAFTPSPIGAGVDLGLRLSIW